VSGIIERRHTLPILSNVLIERSASALAFLATDIEIQIISRGSIEPAGEARAVTVGRAQAAWTSCGPCPRAPR
jgi:DNA polymerase-3 subunit beta